LFGIFQVHLSIIFGKFAENLLNFQGWFIIQFSISECSFALSFSATAQLFYHNCLFLSSTFLNFFKFIGNFIFSNHHSRCLLFRFPFLRQLDYYTS
jgi:hypothetical protein